MTYGNIGASSPWNEPRRNPQFLHFGPHSYRFAS